MRELQDQIEFLSDVMELANRADEAMELARKQAADNPEAFAVGYLSEILHAIRTKADAALQWAKEDERREYSETPRLISISWRIQQMTSSGPGSVAVDLDPVGVLPEWVYDQLEVARGDRASVRRRLEELDPLAYLNGNPDEQGIYLVVHYCEFAGCEIRYSPGPGPGLYYQGTDMDEDENSLSVWKESLWSAMDEILLVRVLRAESVEEEALWDARHGRFREVYS